MSEPFVKRLEHYVNQVDMRLQALLEQWKNDQKGEDLGEGLLAGLPLRMLLAAMASELGRAEQQRAMSVARLHRAFMQSFDPSQITPIPSCMIVRLDPAAGTPPGHSLRRGAKIQPAVGNESLEGDAVSVRYQLAQEVDFWPIDVEKALIERVEDHHELHLVLRARGTRFDKLAGLNRLTVHLHEPIDKESPLARPFQLYEALVTARAVVAGGTTLSPLTVTAHGFGPDENLLPDESRSLPSTRLLQEFAILPERFLFVTLSGLEQARQYAAERLEIVARLEGDWSSLSGVHAGNFVLQAAPAVNISTFKIVDVALPANRFLHPINPNVFGRGPLEILQVRKVSVRGTKEVIPAFGVGRHVYEGETPRWYHICARDPHTNLSKARQRDLAPAVKEEERDAQTGQWQLRIVDADGQPIPPDEAPAAVTVEVQTFHGDAAVGRAVKWTCGDHGVQALNGPTPVLRPVDLVTLAEEQGFFRSACRAESAPALRDRLLSLLDLKAWAPAAAHGALDVRRRSWSHHLVLGVAALTLDDDDGEVMALDHLPEPIWVSGRQCHVKVDPSHFPGGSVFLFGQILDRALADRCAANRFTRFVMLTSNEKFVWKARVSPSQGFAPRFEGKERL